MDAHVNAPAADPARGTTTFPATDLYVDGELRPAANGRRYDNVGPATGAVIGQAADAGTADIDAAVAAARRAFDADGWSRGRDQRVRLLRRWRDELVALSNDWRLAIAAESGAPLGLT